MAASGTGRGTPPAGAPADHDRLRIATWNLWWQNGPWEARQPAILETLRRLDADVVTLQETWGARDGAGQPATLAAALGLEAAALWMPKGTDGHIGLAVLSRWPVERVVRHRLTSLDHEQRWALLVVVASPAGPLTVTTTHLAARHDESALRQAQAAEVARLIAAEHTAPIPPLLTGDLNTTVDADEVRMLLGHTAATVPNLVFTDAWQEGGDGPGHTWSRANPYVADLPWPERRIDYVLYGQPPQGPNLPPVRPHFRVASCRLVGVEPVAGVQPSDHYGVATDLRIRVAGTPTAVAHRPP